MESTYDFVELLLFKDNWTKLKKLAIFGTKADS